MVPAIAHGGVVRAGAGTIGAPPNKINADARDEKISDAKLNFARKEAKVRHFDMRGLFFVIAHFTYRVINDLLFERDARRRRPFFRWLKQALRDARGLDLSGDGKKFGSAGNDL